MRTRAGIGCRHSSDTHHQFPQLGNLAAQGPGTASAVIVWLMNLRSFILATTVPLAMCVASGCGSSLRPLDSGQDVPRGLDATSSCVGLVPGGACTGTPSCTLPAACALCGHDLYTISAPSCGCQSGTWFCSHVDCFMRGPGVFTDPACTVSSVVDAGTLDVTDVAVAPDVIDVVDASRSDACPPRDVFTPVGDATACSSGATLCGSTCVDLSGDLFNCGACGAVCGAGQICLSGSCLCGCPAGRTVCWTGCGECVCTDLTTDDTHCGACGTACAAGQRCAAGACTAGDGGP